MLLPPTQSATPPSATDPSAELMMQTATNDATCGANADTLVDDAVWQQHYFSPRLDRPQGGGFGFMVRARIPIMRSTSDLTKSLLYSGMVSFSIPTLLDYFREDETSAGSKLFFDPRPVKGPIRNAAGKLIEAPASDSLIFLLFSDDDPNANWAHPCRYIFVSQDGILAEALSDYPPLEGMDRLLEL
jgi:hypothetical protein